MGIGGGPKDLTISDDNPYGSDDDSTAPAEDSGKKTKDLEKDAPKDLDKDLDMDKRK